MHASVAVLTERGGVTSHAAVIARGLGLPCIVGASGIGIDARSRTLTAGGRTLRETALESIEATAFYPAGGKNRIRSMVETRPD